MEYLDMVVCSRAAFPCRSHRIPRLFLLGLDRYTSDLASAHPHHTSCCSCPNLPNSPSCHSLKTRKTRPTISTKNKAVESEHEIIYCSRPGFSQMPQRPAGLFFSCLGLCLFCPSGTSPQASGSSASVLN